MKKHEMNHTASNFYQLDIQIQFFLNNNRFQIALICLYMSKSFL